jgi:ATP-binding cassette, subfamily F, member 3
VSSCLVSTTFQKHFGIQPVLQNINFNISAGERIGLIGANGSGKTTLMRILAGLEHPDSGNVASTRPNLRIGYLAQGMDFQPEQTLHSALGLDSDSQTDPALEVESLAQALSQHPNDPAIQAQYDNALARLSTFDLRPEAILGPLGLAHIPADTPIAHLSGGQKTRLMLAKVLLEDPHLLLLDEPTNHLDIEMLEWLEDWLNRFHGAALIVSHDRTFLDNTVTRFLNWIQPRIPSKPMTAITATTSNKNCSNSTNKHKPIKTSRMNSPNCAAPQNTSAV